jgi:hypothetical protein
MKSLLFCVVLLARTTVLAADERTAPGSTPSTTTPQISLMRAADVVDPLTPPASPTPTSTADSTTQGSATEPEPTDSNNLPLPAVRLDANPSPEIAASPVEPQTDQSAAKPKASKVWIASLFAFAGGTTLDGISSWHRNEANPLLSSANGTFAMKGVLIKAGLAAVVMVPQLIHPPKDSKSRTVATLVNFGDAAVYIGAGLHNYMIR